MRKLRMEELNRLEIGDFKRTLKNPLVVVLDNVRSMHNVGSAFRTCDTFLIEKLMLCGITARPPHREIHKTALGAQNSMEWQYFEKTTDAISELKEQGYLIVAIEQTNESALLQNFDIKTSKKYALIFGNEAFGIEDKVLEKVDKAIEIPQYGTKHSLNISVSLGLVVWEFAKHFKP